MTESDEVLNSGRCRCGAYRFRTAADPIQISYCHCSDCRKATGAPVTVFVGFKEEKVELLGDEASIYQSTFEIERTFCSHCGTPIGYRDIRLHNEIYYYLGLFDEPSRFVPQLHAFHSERLEWLNIMDDLLRYQYFSRSR